MLRLINNSRIKEKISSASILDKFNLLSVNQLAAQIKLIEVWKSLYVEGYPIRLEPYNGQSNRSEPGPSLRERPNRVFNDSTRLQMAKSSFNSDAARIWNAAPGEIRSAKSIAEAKMFIRRFVKTLPV